MHRATLSAPERSVAACLDEVRHRGDEAAARAGRHDEVTLVAVTKTVKPDRIVEAYAAGQRVFGENRVQEAATKKAALEGQMPESEWHLVGHLQSNKVKPAVDMFDLIQSVDSVGLARKLNEAVARAGRRTRVLLQINVAEEPSKSGFAPLDVQSAMADLASLEHIEIAGLMTIAPLVSDPEDLRPAFRSLRLLRDRLQTDFPQFGLRHLSMGMSEDFEMAIEEGATMIRIGRALFGERKGAPESA